MAEVTPPEEWVTSTLEKLISTDGIISDGDWVESKDQDVNGKIRLIQLADIGDGEFRDKSQRFMNKDRAEALNCTYLLKNDVLIARMPDPLGRACMFPGVGREAVTVVDICLIRPLNNSAISSKLLTYWINSPAVRNEIEANSSGTTRKRITRKKLEQFILPLPPQAEQKVIADKLDTLLAQVEITKARLDRIPQILKTFRQSVLAAAVSGKLTEEWREENSLLEPISLDDINFYWTAKYLESGKKRQSLKLIESVSLTEVPTSWINTNIGYVFDVYVGATPSRKNEDYWNGDVSWVSSSEVAFCRINSTKETVTKLGLAKTSTNIHPPGTVMLAMIGQGKTRGQVALLDIEACHNQNTAALRVPTNFVVSEYLYFYLTKQYEETRRVGGGNNQQALNKSFVQSLEFPLPPFNEQTEIVRRVEQLFAHADKIEQQVQAAQQRVDKLTQSILAKAFRGELTTQWRKDNPDLITGDNSAEALLAKIKAEREAKSPKKRVKTKKAKG